MGSSNEVICPCPSLKHECKFKKRRAVVTKHRRTKKFVLGKSYSMQMFKENMKNVGVYESLENILIAYFEGCKTSRQ